ncbi:MAG: DUF4230 domain-containing protein [Hydrogenoanaerobacterium sp.]
MKVKKVIIAAIAAVILVVAAFLGGGLWSKAKNPPPPVITSEIVSQRLVGLSELSSVKYLYTNMGKFEESNNFYGWEVPLTKKLFIVSYDGVITAGIDMKNIKIDVTSNKITVTLPPAALLSHTITDGSVQVFDESKNIFNPIKITDYTSFCEDEKTKIEEKALANGLLTEAHTKACDVIKSLLEAVISPEKEYIIIVK